MKQALLIFGFIAGMLVTGCREPEEKRGLDRNVLNPSQEVENNGVETGESDTVVVE